MHGQYDWMRDPALNSQDVRVGHRLPVRPVAALAQLHAPHLHEHPRQGPRHRLRHPADGRGPAVEPLLPGQPGLRVPADAASSSGASRCTTSRSRTSSPASGSWRTPRRLRAGIWRKVRTPDAQGLRAVPGADRPARSRSTLAGNATANLVRNIWAFTIIFCGHFPAGVATFTEEEAEDESRGQLVPAPDARLGQHHRRQAVPHHVAATCRHQIEHHLFPDMPGAPLPGDRGRGAGDLRALRPAVQHRPAAQAARQRRRRRSAGSRCRAGVARPEPAPESAHAARWLPEVASPRGRRAGPARWRSRSTGGLELRVGVGELLQPLGEPGQGDLLVTPALLRAPRSRGR